MTLIETARHTSSGGEWEWTQGRVHWAFAGGEGSPPQMQRGQQEVGIL